MDKLSRNIDIGKHELSRQTLLEDPPSLSAAIFVNNECCKDGSGVLFSEQGLFTADEQEKMVLTCFLTAERCQVKLCQDLGMIALGFCNRFKVVMIVH